MSAKKSHTIKDQVAFLRALQEELKGGKINPTEATAQSKLSHAMSMHYKNQLKYMMIHGKNIKVDFLEG